MHGIRHSFFPNSSFSHCAPLIVDCSSTVLLRLNPFRADCAIDTIVEFSADAATEAVSKAASCKESERWGCCASKYASERVLSRPSNQSERKS